MKRSALWRAALLWIALAPWADPAQALKIGSCYERHLPKIPAPAPSRELYIFVDQTLDFSESLRGHADRRIFGSLREADRVLLIPFSAFAAGRYPRIEFEGAIERDLSPAERFPIPKRDLRRFDACRQRQRSLVHQKLKEALHKTFEASNPALPKTDLISTVGWLNLRRVSKLSKGGERSLLFISDMLENSNLLSFYPPAKLQGLAPEAAVAKLREAGETSSLEGSCIYVIGAAYSLVEGYVTAAQLRNLERFWELFFAASNARLVEFGRPELGASIGGCPG
ncbi:MAG: hypothetical protein OXU92_03705 [Deltaproteobacteria bacterium]|nr:hypothetical protein [Deltaproteobacteria bacterium]MDD9827474.1 hypothetical protein [Deltaproteobacteria bacterium]